MYLQEVAFVSTRHIYGTNLAHKPYVVGSTPTAATIFSGVPPVSPRYPPDEKLRLSSIAKSARPRGDCSARPGRCRVVCAKPRPRCRREAHPQHIAGQAGQAISNTAAVVVPGLLPDPDLRVGGCFWPCAAQLGGGPRGQPVRDGYFAYGNA